MAVVVSSSKVPPDSEAIREAEPPCFPTLRQLFALFLAYFALHIVIRTLLSSSVDLDESEQVMLTQKFSWGYGSDPPVYTWVQMAFFAVFGKSVFALALMKNLLLLATYGFVYLSTRLLTRSHRCGAAAALSLLFIPHIVWESQRDLTHTVLASASAAATLFCFLRAHESNRTRWYLALGLCGGVGFLAKYNFGFWAVGLVAAALSLPQYRASVLNRRTLMGMAVGLFLVLPNVFWVVGHPDLALHTTSKLGIEGSSNWLRVVWTGLRHIIQAIAAFIGPPALVYLLVFLRAPRTATNLRDGSAGAQLLSRAFLFVIALLVVLVLFFRATGFRERWFQPILLCVPVLGITLFRERLDVVRLRRLTWMGLTVMCAVTLLLPGRILFIERLGREEPLSRPYAQLARQMRPVLPASTLLVTDTMVLGGNLLLALPGQRAATVELAKLLDDGTSHRAVVWDATQRELPPKPLAEWAQLVGSVDWARAQPQYFTATYKFHHSRQYRLGLLVVY